MFITKGGAWFLFFLFCVLSCKSVVHGVLVIVSVCAVSSVCSYRRTTSFGGTVVFVDLFLGCQNSFVRFIASCLTLYQLCLLFRVARSPVRVTLYFGLRRNCFMCCAIRWFASFTVYICYSMRLV